MPYDLNIIGSTDPLRVEEGADELIERWSLFRTKKIQDEPVKIAGWVGMLSSIKSFRPVEKSRSDGIGSSESNNEYRRDLSQIRSLTPEARAKRLGFFRMVYWGFTQKYSDGTDIEKKAEDIQRSFFTKHPKRIFCDVTEFQALLPKAECDKTIIGIIERQIQQDKFASRFL